MLNQYKFLLINATMKIIGQMWFYVCTFFLLTRKICRKMVKKRTFKYTEFKLKVNFGTGLNPQFQC